MVHHFNSDVRNGNGSSELHIKDKARFLISGLKARLRKNVTGLKSIDRELYGSGITLKNLALVEKEQPLSAETIFEKLMENSQALKPLYQELINLYRAGRDEEAFMVFGERTGTKAGQHFAMILSKLDKINPWELTEQMDVFQEMMAEQRMTEAMKEVQRLSVIQTAWATAAIFCLLINFTVVVIFLDMLQALSGMF